MDPASSLAAARRRAGLTQHELAVRAETSQAAVSSYEAGRKQPSVATYQRLLAAAGARLQVVAASPVDPETAGRRLEQVLALAEELPFRRPGPLAYPALPEA